MFKPTRPNASPKLYFIPLALCLIIAMSLVPSARSAAQGAPPPPSVSYFDVSGLGHKPASAHLDTGLDALNVAWERATETGLAFDSATTADQFGLEVEGDRVKVMMVMLDEQAAADAISALPDYGAEMTTHYETWVDAWVPISELDAVSKLPGVSIIQRPLMAHHDDIPAAPAAAPLQTGPVNSEGVAPSGAAYWHSQNHKGAFAPVAIMDSFANYNLSQAAGELPGAITGYTTYTPLDFSSVHGTGVAEIIYDMAPNAPMTFASTGSVTETANTIVGLSTSGHKVINASWSYFNIGPGDGTGPLQNAITTARNNGTLFVKSSGNYGQGHYDAQFVDFGDNSHAVGDGGNVNDFYVGSTRTVTFYMRWNAWPTTNQDYDLYLLRWNGSAWQLVASSTASQTGSQTPTEAIQYTATGGYWYGIVIASWSSTENHVIDLFGLNLGTTLQHMTVPRSIGDPGDAINAFTVGAVSYSNPYGVRSYSSQGPSHGPGGSLAFGTYQPRISGYDCVSTSGYAYGPGGFCGTSAASPHVAGAAALVFGRWPTYNASQVASFLEVYATDLGTAGYDLTYGFGRVTLPAFIFADVPEAGKEWMWPWIHAFYNAGITSGCLTGPLRYCPNNKVTRAEMAVFIVRAEHYPTLPHTPDNQGGTFADVPVEGKEWMEDWIEEFYDLGITQGCLTGPLRFCPESNVTRAEMAVFLLRAIEGGSYTPPAASDYFADVPVDGKEWMMPWIDELYRRGITSGCLTGPLRFCPEALVTRAEMAVFINRAYGTIPNP